MHALCSFMFADSVKNMFVNKIVSKLTSDICS